MATKTMDLPTLIERFGSEDKCRAYMEDLRWPDGVECPRCEERSISRIEKRRQYECNSCRYQFSVTAGTVFHDSHLPLWKWFLAIYMTAESKKGISAKQLERTLGVSYKTAWYLSHRIRSAMEEDSPVPLKGIVEVDETYVGGERRRGKGTKGGPGRGTKKTMVIGAIERGGQVRFQVGDRPTKKTLHAFIRDVVSDDAEAIHTDAWQAYGGIEDENTRHEFVSHNQGEWIRGIVHTNTVEGVWSLLKRSIVGSYHQLSAKHLPAYLDEVAFKFNNRDNPFLFRDTLLRLIQGETLEYKELTAHG
jgi:transposase-like protein